MLISWSPDLSGSPETSQILSQFLWFKKEGTAIHFPKSFNKDTNFIMQLFGNGRIISWVSMSHIDMNWQVACFFNGLNQNMQFLRDEKN